MEFEIILHECFLGDPLPYFLKPFTLKWTKWQQEVKNKKKKKKKKKKNPLNVLNQWMDFEIISQECSLSDSLPTLLKPFRSDEQNGCQSK